MAVRKEIEKIVSYKEFQRSVEKLLTPADKDYLFYAMKEYQTYKSVAKLMLALNSCLDTPEKLDLLPYVRDLIPKHDKKRFDSLAPYNRMAHPIARDPPTPVAPKNVTSKVLSPTRVVNLQRLKGTPLGFSIRGGQEHDLGIYVSHIDPFSIAEQCGLQVGDQISKVNGIDFNRVMHSSAVLVLKSHDNLKIEVRSTGIVPAGQKLNRNSFVWVDAEGKPISEKTVHRKTSIDKREERSGDRLLSSVSRHKVVLHSNQKRGLGFSIRGGSEYGLGIYISVVDAGSPSGEAGLHIGDQIMDVNGHSFVAILHYEAVHILRSYQTLIMTIKSLGRLPALQKENEQKEAPIEKSPTSRRKGSGFLKSFGLPRSSMQPSSPTIMEEEEPPIEPATIPRSYSLPVERSQSARYASDRVKPKVNRAKSQSQSQGIGVDSVDSPGQQIIRQRSGSEGTVGSKTFPMRSSTPKKRMAISPLATHETRASTPISPLSSPENSQQFKVTPKFFERGVGTQVMLASTTSQAKQLLFDKARKLLSHDEIDTLREDCKQYEDTGNIIEFAHCIIAILNTPLKMELITEIRSVLNPVDIVKFDRMVSHREAEALNKRNSDAGLEELMETEKDKSFQGDVRHQGMEKQFNIVLSSIQTHQGLKRFKSEREKSASADLGAFGNSAAQSVLNKATANTSAPDLVGLQSKESFLAWYETEEDHRNTGDGNKNEEQKNETETTGALFPENVRRASKNPVIIEVEKVSPFFGLTVEERPGPCIHAKEVHEGGSVQIDGFIQPGFEIVEVDNKRLRGKTYDEAVRIIDEGYNSDNPVVNLIVIPN